MKFKTRWTNPLQVILGVAQVANIAMPFLSPRGQAIAAGVVGLAQVVIHTEQAYKNPDGTPARTQWTPESRQMNPNANPNYYREGIGQKD